MHGFFVASFWRLCVAVACFAPLGAGVLVQDARSSALRRASFAGALDQRAWKGFRGRVGTPEILEDYKDGGHGVRGSMTDAQLASRLSTITGQRYNEELHAVVDPAPSRFVAHPGNAQAASFVKQRLSQLGYEIREQSLGVVPSAVGPVRGNIIGFRRGSDLANELVVFGAHFDSVNWDNTLGSAPGVDDNASGMAALLLVAEAVAGSDGKAGPSRRSVAIVAFQAEEVGLVGSKAFVKDILLAGDYGTPVATIIADQISYAGRPQFHGKAIFETVGRTAGNVALVDTLAQVTTALNTKNNLGGVTGFEVNYHGFGSDHIPFLDAGLPAVLLIERDNLHYADNWGHTSSDTFDHVDPSFGAAMARVAASAILTLASPSGAGQVSFRSNASSSVLDHLMKGEPKS